MKNKVLMIVVTIAIMVFMALCGGRTVKASEASERLTEGRGSSYVTVMREEGTNGTDSGVTELDSSLGRGKKLLVGVIHFFGAAVALFGIVFAAIGFLGRDQEQKMIGITAFIVGIAVFFAPQIVNAVVGQTVF